MSYKILSKFVKDISFEIPNVEAYALLEKEISKYNLNFDIKSRPFNYSTLISLEAKVEKKDLEKIVLISIPTEVYPTIYEIFVYLFSQAGMKNVSITKEVNFEKMYNEKNKN